MASFTGDGNGGFTLHTKYGDTFFKNSQKFYKFQLLCNHPSSYHYDDDGTIEEICEKCCSVLSEKRGCVTVYKSLHNGWMGCRLPEEKKKDVEPEPDQLARWADDGGCYG